MKARRELIPSVVLLLGFAPLLVVPATPRASSAGDPGPAAPASAAAAPTGAPAAARGGEASDEQYRRALALYRDGRFHDALEAIHQGMKSAGRTPALYALAGWCRLRLGEIGESESAFRAALALDGAAIDPRVGLGYALLRRGQPRAAAAEFDAALARAPGNLDALKGKGLALRNQGRGGDAAVLFRRVLHASPGDAEAKQYLDQVLGAAGEIDESRPRPPAAPDLPVAVVARAGAGYLEIAGEGGFRPIFVKGINMGVALPGRFPAEFPEDPATYADWLEQIAAMGGNAVRLYTLLPPAFYAALERHNRRDPARRLWLVQGVWTELPADDDYDGKAFRDGFAAEIRRVIDAVHGNLDLPARPGHASGAYRADVSTSTLAYLLGREWEPYSVQAFDRKGRAGGPPFEGDYFAAADGATPFEAWLASILDLATAYETAQYRAQHPVSFVNWPTLDPLTHPTEASVAEELQLRQARGEPPEHPILEYDNDTVSVDARRIVPRPGARAGVYASYHAYPYYPDFMNLDPGYARARDRAGPCNYIGYLRDLKRHHGSQPVLIAEFGVPSSRGVSHLQPQGFDQGSHSETRQGEIDAHLLGDIREAGMAGGILFALLDEWFKRNWLVSEFEIPADHNARWLNVLDPEQNYGILAARPGPSPAAPPGGAPGVAGAGTVGIGGTEAGAPRRPSIRIDGRGEDWAGIRPLVEKRQGGPEKPLGDGHDAARTLRGLSAASDEAYLYLRLDVDRLDADGDGSPDWKDAAYVIGIDTYDADRGDHRLPVDDGTASPVGLEFCVILDGAGTARLLVDLPYDIETHRYHRPYGSVRNADGRFMEIRAVTNRARLGRDGTLYPERGTSRSPLLHASTEKGDPDYNTRADWHVGGTGDFLELRLGWGLLNVTDPSTRRVLQDNPGDLRSIGTVTTAGFRFIAAAFKPGGAPGGPTPVAGRVVDRLPAGDRPGAGRLPLYSWAEWEQPTYHIERKDAWAILKAAFAALPDPEGPR